jgi:O-antigen/teichoic acid export membrane protein
VSTSRAVARGTSRLVAGLLSAKALDFVFYLLLARHLGVERFGRYTFALSFTLLFSIVADFGLATVFTREASRNPAGVRALLGQVMRVKLGLGAVTLVASTGILFASRALPVTVLLVAFLTTAMLLNSAALLLENLLKSASRSGAAGMSVLAQSVTALSVCVALVFSGYGVMGGACAYLAASVVHLTSALIWSRDLWRRPAAGSAAPAAPPWRDWKGLLRESAPLALSGVFIAVYFRIDSVLLRVFKGESATGLYGGVYRFFEAFVLLSAAYRSVLFPVMARAADDPSQSLGVLCRKSLRLHLMFTVGVAVFVMLQARAIVGVVLGPAYLAAAPALAILVWALPGAFMADTLLHLLAAQRRQSLTARAMAVTAAFNLGANLLIIPRYSLYGAAATTVASELLSFLLMFLVFNRSVPRISLFEVARAPLIAGAIAGCVLLLLSPLSPGGPPGLMLMASFALTAYVLALVALGALGRQDFELVREILPAALRPPAGADRRFPPSRRSRGPASPGGPRG